MCYADGYSMEEIKWLTGHTWQTVTSSCVLVDFHDHMPLILSKEKYDDWLIS